VIRFFRLVSMIEGLSLLTLLFVAMPLRTYADMPLAVTYAGWIHGILYLFYGAVALVVSHRQSWSILQWLLLLFLGAVPFAFTWVDWRLRRALPPLGAAPRTEPS